MDFGQIDAVWRSFGGIYLPKIVVESESHSYIIFKSLLADMLHDESLGHRQKTVVSTSVEVGVVCFSSALKIYTAEAVTIYIDAAVARTVEDGNAVGATYFKHGIDNLLAVAPYEILASPRREEKNLSLRIAID